MDRGGSEDGGNEKRNDRAAPDSAALIFNDILQRARVPLMHGHSKYASLFSFLLRPMLFPRALPSRFVAARPDNASLKVSTIRALQFLLLASRPARKIGRAFRLLPKDMRHAPNLETSTREQKRSRRKIDAGKKGERHSR